MILVFHYVFISVFLSLSCLSHTLHLLVCLSVHLSSESLFLHLSRGCPVPLHIPPPLVSHSLCICQSLSPARCLSQKNARRSDGWSIRKRLTGVRSTRETALAREEGSKWVTYLSGRAELQAPHLCQVGGSVCAVRVALSRATAITACQRPNLSPLFWGARKLVALRSAWAPARPGMPGPSPSPTGGLSQGPTPLLGPFCESDVITDGNGAFSFYLALRGAGSIIRFPRHQAGSGRAGLLFFSLLLLAQVESKSGA